MLPSDELLPVLVADLDDPEARELLAAAARAGSEMWVPLETAPINAEAHVLEIHLPGVEPFFFMARPLGPPGKEGFPLRLEPMRDGPPPPPPRPGLQLRNFVRGRRPAPTMALSESHTKDLSYVGPMPTDDSEDPNVGRALAGGKLLIEQLIGQGGVGAVYKARHRELKMPVAVKVLHESFQSDIDFCRRFYAEALAASRLDHPNITRVLDFGQEPNGQLYFAMEFLDGVELRAVLDREKRLPTVRIASLMMQVCAALSHAHVRGIVHRDIKPENLVLVATHDDDGQPTEVVKVCDFGIAVHRALPESASGEISGTPEYMSPEQCRGDELDARSDVYACGVVLYELATGKVPFTAERSAQILNKHQFTPPLPPSHVLPGVDPRLEAIILRALAKDVSARHQSMRELRNDLRRILEVDSSPLPPFSMREAPSLLFDEPPLTTRGRLDRGGPAGPPSTAAVSTGQLATDAASDTLAANAVAWCKRLAQTPDPSAFAQAAQKLEGAVRALAQRGEVDALWTMSTTMHGIASEGRGEAGSRAASAAKLLRVLEDPAILAQIAEQLLNGPESAREKARRLLVNGGVAGVHGLYGARVKLARVPTVRSLFVAALKDFGPKAWPVVKAALEKIVATPTPNAAILELAEDLLFCVPSAGDESAGHLVVKFLRSPHANVCRAAAAAIIKLWGDRAKPVFVAMVQAKEDVIRATGIAGLRQLGAIDEHLVPRLEGILVRRVPAGDELRAAAATALAHASPSAKQPVLSLLTRMLKEPPGTPASVKEDAVVLAAARSLLAVGGAPYRGLVAERAERSAEPLRERLRALAQG